MNKNISIFFVSLFLVFLSDCNNKKSGSDEAIPSNQDTTRYQPKEYVQLKHPEWSKNATIYEVNIRQYTPEGTFKAFENHLKRLKNMGVGILWIMPVNPVGEVNRKGTLGSPYSVKDYYGINPEFGNMQDFKRLVDTIHALGMHVILDWVANHSAWDNQLVKEHPDWYIKNREGNFQPTPWRDYDDIIDFDYNQPGIRKYMTDAMKYWLKETNIDGFRCDVASFVPLDFWENTRTELDHIKPVFMLAEAADRDLHQHAFDMTYSWNYYKNVKFGVDFNIVSYWDVVHKAQLLMILPPPGATIEEVIPKQILQNTEIFIQFDKSAIKQLYSMLTNAKGSLIGTIIAEKLYREKVERLLVYLQMEYHLQ